MVSKHGCRLIHRPGYQLFKNIERAPIDWRFYNNSMTNAGGRNAAKVGNSLM